MAQISVSLTPYEQHALRQAQRKTEMENTGVPTVTRYRFDELALSNGDLNVKVLPTQTDRKRGKPM